MKENFLESQEFEKRTKAGLNWLKRSFDKSGDSGSSAYFSQLWKPFGWQLSYPETTGYIIETLLDYDLVYPQMELKKYALNAADWICTLQMPNGALPGGLGNSKEPSVFNTGQMLFGLIRAYELTNDQKYYDVFSKATFWLASMLEKDGSWKSGAYIEGFTPSYYTRIAWPVLLANKHIKNCAIHDKMVLALSYYRSKLTSKFSVNDWAFRIDQKAFTHTIAYTIRGFYESSILIGDKELKDISINIAENVLKLRELNGKLAGWYDENWKGDYWFLCLTGNCQMSIIFNKIYEETGDVRFLNTALKVFEDVVWLQNMSRNKNKYGALPGSSPFYGRYLSFRYPNWATKFFLDAYLVLYNNLKSLESKI